MSKLLIIDDDEALRVTLKLYLKDEGYELFDADGGKSALDQLESIDPDLVLCDIKMPDMSGLDVLEKIKEYNSNIQVIMITAFNDVSSTISAMQKNAFDYVTKPLDIPNLKEKLRKALEIKNISGELTEFRVEEELESDTGKKLVGKSPVMQEIYKYIGQLSLNKLTVLLQGDSGTGKEMIARVIHESGSKGKPFVAVNCSALMETLLESELFGHVNGAFTGAIRDKKGKFELAGNGTIFLDEISEVSLTVQSKLLRVLQEKEFEKIGGETTLKMNARIITATNKNLEELVKEGKFREDLYYRLKVFTINVPPLKDRKEDIPLLAMHFIDIVNKEVHKNVKKIPYDVMELIQNHNWVGNVRELENTLRQAVVLCKSDVLDKDSILLSKPRPDHLPNYDYNLSLEDVEKKHIKYVLDNINWDKKRACQILGISKPTLYSKLEKYNLKPINKR
ncbi:sigma-54 dependent DNA-binding response regulator [hydrothermal vent metagenome]|uniref:Sigma-54 dependent DNA-binding response regulator n=1 Tax=hydrothermal vent metagenome TaxID=652676 RepID=A0A3B1DKK5_9ZZZZ